MNDFPLLVAEPTANPNKKTASGAQANGAARQTAWWHHLPHG